MIIFYKKNNGGNFSILLNTDKVSTFLLGSCGLFSMVKLIYKVTKSI